MLRIGIIGAGHFARAHLKAIRRHASRVTVVLTARTDTRAAWPEAEKMGAKMVTTEELLASPDLDAVLVCSPNHLHAGHAIAALQARKHVFCEKPMALGVAEADAMIAASEASGRVLMVGHLTRHAPLYAPVAEALFSGTLGRPIAANMSRMHTGGADRLWRMDPRLGGGVVFDLLIHDLDLLNWFLGPPLCVSALGHRHALGSYDHISAVLAHSGDVSASAEASFLLRPGARPRATLRILCERGHIDVDSADTAKPVQVCEEGRAPRDISLDLADALTQGLYSEQEEFLDAMDGARPTRLRLDDARIAVLVAEKTIASADHSAVHTPIR